MSGLSPLARLLLAKDTLRTAARDLEKTVRDLYPVGFPIEWVSGLHRQRGFVESHGYGDRLFVRNERTGKQVRIYSSAIIEALREDEDRDIARELDSVRTEQ
ncbi:MAG: hypothetical protein ACK4PN_08565 [Allorhizobium sp.]